MPETNRLGCRLDLERLNGGYANGLGNAVREALVNSGEDGDYRIANLESVE